MKITRIPSLLGGLLALGVFLPVQSFGAEEILRLEALDLSRMSSGWKKPAVGESVAGGALRVAGEPLAHGVGVHAPSDFTVALDGAGLRFKAKVGVDDSAPQPGGTLEFIVKGDGRELWRSGAVKRGEAARVADVPLEGVKLLRLEVDALGDGFADHADWGEAQIVYRGARPESARREGEFEIEAGPTTLRFRVDPSTKRLLQLACGPAVTPPGQPAQPADEVYPTWGDGLVSRPALRVRHADGNTSSALVFVSREERETAPGVRETRVFLKDPEYPFFTTLVYRVYATEGLIEQWSELRHEEPGAVTLDRFASAAPLLGHGTYYLTSYHAGWANEVTPQEERLARGTKIVESAQGVRVHLEAAPSFLLSSGAPATETGGEVFGATLAYPGSFQFQFETSSEQSLRVICGINPEASAYRLKPGETFRTPSLIFGWSSQGKGDLSRRFARWGREHGMRDGDRPRAVLLNNWEATEFGFNESKLEALIKDTRELGMELFLLDDGWFGEKYPRDFAARGLGDWVTDKKKLPSGLAHLPAVAKQEGVRFGLWVEPEMVNPESELYRLHPDWVIGQRHRKPRLTRDQLVLDLSNPEVRTWINATIDRILTENPGISYLKWDCNRGITQPGSNWLTADEQSHMGVEYQRGLYAVLDHLAEKHPDVELMLCASGGGRVDYGSLRRGHEFWTSDNTDALARVRLQWDTAQFFPQIAIAAHVTHMGKRPLKFAFDVAMSARLGLDLDTPHLSEADRAFTKQAISNYRSIRPVVQFGDLYRLEAPHDRPRAAQMSVSSDKTRAVVFAWQLRDGGVAPLVLAGLDPKANYHVREINRTPGAASALPEEGAMVSGETLMRKGLTPPLAKTYDSIIVELTAAR